MTINSAKPGIGIGTLLIQAVAQAAREAGCKRLWLMTTNDNLDALRFYQKRGFTLVAVHRQAVDAARMLSPGITHHGAESLALCFGLEPRELFSHVPTKSGETTLTVTQVEDGPTRGTVDPWPFHEEAFTLRCEGRRLPETFADEEAMRVAITHAPWVTIAMQLVRS